MQKLAVSPNQLSLDIPEVATLPSVIPRALSSEAVWYPMQRQEQVMHHGFDHATVVPARYIATRSLSQRDAIRRSVGGYRNNAAAGIRQLEDVIQDGIVDVSVLRERAVIGTHLAQFVVAVESSVTGVWPDKMQYRTMIAQKSRQIPRDLSPSAQETLIRANLESQKARFNYWDMISAAVGLESTVKDGPLPHAV